MGITMLVWIQQLYNFAIYENQFLEIPTSGLELETGKGKVLHIGLKCKEHLWMSEW